jgi:hypothetical protein
VIAWIAKRLAHKLAPIFVVVLGLGLLGTAGGWGVTALKLGTARLEAANAATALAQALAEHERFVAAAATFAAAVAEQERKRDLEHRKRLSEIEDAHQKEQQAADERERRLADEHRAGLVRVRREVCEGSPRPNSPAGTTASTGMGLPGSAVRENPAIAAVRVGARADAELRQCRAYVVAQAERCPQVAP